MTVLKFNQRSLFNSKFLQIPICAYFFMCHHWLWSLWESLQFSIRKPYTARNPNWRGRFSTVYLLVQTSLDQLLLILQKCCIFYKTSYLNEEVNSTEHSLLIGVPCIREPTLPPGSWFILNPELCESDYKLTLVLNILCVKRCTYPPKGSFTLWRKSH